MPLAESWHTVESQNRQVKSISYFINCLEIKGKVYKALCFFIQVHIFDLFDKFLLHFVSSWTPQHDNYTIQIKRPSCCFLLNAL